MHSSIIASSSRERTTARVAPIAAGPHEAVSTASLRTDPAAYDPEHRPDDERHRARDCHNAADDHNGVLDPIPAIAASKRPPTAPRIHVAEPDAAEFAVPVAVHVPADAAGSAERAQDNHEDGKAAQTVLLLVLLLEAWARVRFYLVHLLAALARGNGDAPVACGVPVFFCAFPLGADGSGVGEGEARDREAFAAGLALEVEVTEG